MKKLFLCLALVMSMTACATSTPAPIAAEASSSVTGFATLATFGTWEMDLAPAYTRLAALRHRAARQLEAQRLSLAAAVDIQAFANNARGLLDRSRRGSMTSPALEQRAALAEASRLMDLIEQHLEH